MNEADNSNCGPEAIDPAAEPLRFFDRAHGSFLGVLAKSETRDDPIDALADRAFELFASATARDACTSDRVACHGGCASCCTMRVAATAPEIFALARHIRALPEALSAELSRRIAAADRATHRLDEAQRCAAGIACPFVDGGLCSVYSVRPLACRGHASFDAQACIDALSGRACEVPVSTLHMNVRSLVQNAMQSALRDARYAWGVYELNQSLFMALTDVACEAAWIRGEDIFAPAAIHDVSREEMAATFDAIKAQVDRAT